MTPNPEAPMQQPSWFSRNWKWLLPVGCLVPLLCCGSFAGFTAFTVAATMKSSVAFTEGLSRASANEEVRAALGTPIEASGFPMGSVNSTNGRGTADVTVGLTGPKGKGTLHVSARSTGPGKWEFDVIDVDVEGGATINVLGDTQEAPLPEPDEEEPAPTEE